MTMLKKSTDSDSFTSLMNIFVLGAGGVSCAYLAWRVYSTYKYKYPQSANKKISPDAFSQNAEQALLDIAALYPDECTLEFASRGFFESNGPKKIVFLNSMEAVRKFTKSNDKTNAQSTCINNRCKNFVFKVLSKNYLGSFFRMSDPKLLEIRQASQQGLFALMSGESDFKAHLSVEISALTAFLAANNGMVLKDASIYLQQMSTNILVTLGLGARFEYELDVDAPVKKQIRYITDLLSSLNIVALSDFFESDFHSQKNTKEFLEERLNGVYGFLTNAINGYKATFTPGEVKTFADFAIGKQLAKLKETNKDKLEASETFSDDDILVQVFTLFMAGACTMGFSLTWAFYYLGQNKMIQAKIAEEIKANVSDNEQVGLHHGRLLPYTESVIQEILRLGSNQPLVARGTQADCQIGDYSLPKDTTVVINAFAMHRDPNYWPEPEQFKPERWLATDGSCNTAFNSDAFMAYGTKPRGCIGKLLSRNIFFTLIGNLVRSFEFEYIADPTKAEEKMKSKLGYMRLPHAYDLKINQRVI